MSLVAVAFFSCEPTYTKTYSWAYPVAGDWKVKVTVDGAPVSWQLKPFEIKSYNSSFGKDSIWIDDYAAFWPMKFKAAVNMASKTFHTPGSMNLEASSVDGNYYPVVIKNGKIVGNDSIYFEAVFGDDPTTTYVLAGHREVSYEEYTQQ